MHIELPVRIFKSGFNQGPKAKFAGESAEINVCTAILPSIDQMQMFVIPTIVLNKILL